MKTAPDGRARVEFEVRFPRAPRGRKVDACPEPPALRPAPPQVPRITQLLVLGHHFERLVRDGVVKDYAEIARLAGLSRARVTQIVNLTLLPPHAQERILAGRSGRKASHRMGNPAGLPSGSMSTIFLACHEPVSY